LTVVLFVQQVSRQSDIFFGVKIPTELVWQLTIALIPSVIAFTSPMACLVGVMIGLARLKSDSEMVAIQASGVGNWQIFKPILILGILLSGFSLFINWKGVPFASQLVRQVTVKAAIAKLESPIDVGQFNLEIPDYVFYVGKGNFENGAWQNILIHSETKDGVLRLITARGGNLNSNGDSSELHLENASVATFETAKLPILEKLNVFNFAIPTKRSEFIKKLTDSTIIIEELGLVELADVASQKEGKEKVEAELLLFRRITLSIAPLIFVFLGTSLSLRFSRGGRGLGIILALIVLSAYYLCILFGEQMARSGRISVAFGSFLPILFALFTGLFFFWRNKFPSRLAIPALPFELPTNGYKSVGQQMWNSRLLDFDLLSGLFKYYFLSVTFFTLIYLIFTSFELWKFTSELDNGTLLLGKYFTYLIPFVYSQISASCVMLAILTTYTLKSRGNEVVTWISAGQSVYRLLLPCLFFCVLIGSANWFFQETIIPESNRRQDYFRSQIRNKGVAKAQKDGDLWIADNKNVYRFSKSVDSKNGLQVFTFEDENLTKLKSAVFAQNSKWDSGILKASGNVQIFTINENSVFAEKRDEFDIQVAENPNGKIIEKTSYLTTNELQELLDETTSEAEKRSLNVGLNKKYTTIFMPLIVLLLISPFALSIHRRGKVQSIGFAVAIWLLLLGFANTFEQFGLNGSLVPSIAVWSPLLIFGLVGGFLLTRLKT
jgi:lipopolysaccharide export LptBFGC system permease protein LptF